MGTKRPASEIHPSRRPQVPSAKKRKTNPHPHRKLEPSNHAINPLKARIRSIKRLLEHKENLPADVRLNHERELASCTWQLEEAERERKKSEMIGRYHMVRFFDRQKATRKLKQVKKKAKECEGTEEEGVWKQKVHEGEVDVNYAQYYPLDQVYSALYPTGGKKKKKDQDGGDQDGDVQMEAEAEAKEEERKGDPDMWKVVEKCMEKGKLDALRNGTLFKTVAAPKTDDDIALKEKKSDKKKLDKKNGKAGKSDHKADKNERNNKHANEQAEDEDSDGGFFE